MTKPSFGGYVTSATTPDGVVCGYARDFAVMSLASDEYTIQWSDIGDSTSWSTPGSDAARAAQAGQQTLNLKHGFITGIAGNDFFMYVFQQRAITKAVYVGGDVVWSFDTFEEGRGCFEYGRFVQIDDAIFFESEFGYHVLENDQILGIGYEMVDDSQTPISSTSQQNVTVNPAIQMVFFGSQDLAFNYKTGHWTQLLAFADNNYYSIDDATGVIGQVVFEGTGATKVFDLQTSTGGVAVFGKITTKEIDMNQGGRAIMMGVTPLVRSGAITGGGIVTVQIGVRDNFNESVRWSERTSVNPRTGQHDVRMEGRYHRIEFTMKNGFATALGVDVDFVPSGTV